MFKPRSTGTGKAIATGIISALAAAGVTYFLYGTQKGAQKRAKIKGWAADVRDNVKDTFSKEDVVDVVAGFTISITGAGR
ncbi:MAG: hypothetical protein V4481_00130, partial [Patescibacteria group bacterium]